MLLPKFKRHNLQHFMLQKRDTSIPRNHKLLSVFITDPLIWIMLFFLMNAALGVAVYVGTELGTATGTLITNAIRIVDPAFTSFSLTSAKLKPLKALGSTKLQKIQDSE